MCACMRACVHACMFACVRVKTYMNQCTVCCRMLLCVVVCCIALQSFTLCYSVLHCVAVWYSVSFFQHPSYEYNGYAILQGAAGCVRCDAKICFCIMRYVARIVCCSVLQCVAVCCSVSQILRCVAVCCSMRQCVAVCRSVLILFQFFAVCCSVLQHIISSLTII